MDMTTVLVLIAIAALIAGPIVIKNRNSKFAGSEQAKLAEEKPSVLPKPPLLEMKRLCWRIILPA